MNHNASRLAMRFWRAIFVGATTLLLLAASILVAVPAVSPTAGAATADILRSVVGPEPVAQLESMSYWMRDHIYRGLAATGVGAEAPGVAWASGSSPSPAKLPAGSGAALVANGGPGAQSSNPSGVPELAPAAVAQAPQEAATGVVSDAPQIGWQAYGPTFHGAPAMARALIMVDPQRSYAGVALVRMDLSSLALHIVPGYIEPAHPSGIDQKIPNIGEVAPADYGNLIAAFNGGFKALHGHYGMMANGVTLLPPQDGMATVAVYRDGTVRMGAWGTDLLPSPDMVAFRQNCPPLIDAGVLNPALTSDARGAWGFTNNSDITWRTGLGMTQDSRYLIYAVGNGTDAEFLAQALQKAGAYDAMQLDINQYYAHFVTYAATSASTSSGTTLQAQRLLQEMIDARELYLTPSVRDFFYLTTR